jgi:hypothetical protein
VAIADLSRIPKEVRQDLDVLAQFGKEDRGGAAAQRDRSSVRSARFSSVPPR